MLLIALSAVRALLAAGADPNLGEEFSTVYNVAKQKQINSLHGMLSYTSKNYFYKKIHFGSASKLCLSKIYFISVVIGILVIEERVL